MTINIRISEPAPLDGARLMLRDGPCGWSAICSLAVQHDDATPRYSFRRERTLMEEIELRSPLVTTLAYRFDCSCEFLAEITPSTGATVPTFSISPIRTTALQTPRAEGRLNPANADDGETLRANWAASGAANTFRGDEVVDDGAVYMKRLKSPPHPHPQSAFGLVAWPGTKPTSHHVMTTAA